ncbi:BNR-4 repeat-containing protein [Microvirga sp. BT689]|uniref:BNR-4 repeat-containing protein n=1 Tax=Microvirga arvi TaxID=2778731 RepID=UPI0019526C88|nr:BNR-4 repeat-containing protein [Microvirga arvi]MBM6582744.1 BNR-4 repeat-containing protein [Microvirga arvi]
MTKGRTGSKVRPPRFLQPVSALDLGLAWAGNSVNCVPYRTSAVVTRHNQRYVSYFDETGDVIVGHHDLGDDQVHRERIRNERPPHDAHQAISMGFDPTDHLHLAFGAHNSSLLTTRSRASDLRAGFAELVERHQRATYPMFLELAGGELALLYRHGRHFEGEIRVERYDPDQETWTGNDTPLITGFAAPWSCGPYLNTPVVDHQGNVHLFVVWRVAPPATSAGAVVNAGIDAFVSRDGLQSLSTHQGVQLSGPVTPMNSERVIAVPLGSSLINQAAAAVLPGNRPAVLTYWDAGDGVVQYRLGWRDEAPWRLAPMSRFTTRFRLDGGGTLPLPHSRPALVVHEDGRIIILHRSLESGNRLVATEVDPPDYEISRGRVQTLVDEDLGFYEPIVDHSAWTTRRELVLYVQHCEQGLGRDGKPDHATAPARLMAWKPV